MCPSELRNPFGLSPQDFAVWRSPVQHSDWAIASTERIVRDFGRSAFLYGTHPLVKKLREEAFYVSMYVQLRFPAPTEVLVRVEPEQTSYDAQIRLDAATPPVPIQVTHAFSRREGEQQELQSRYIELHHWGPATFTATFRRNDAGEIVVTQMHSPDHIWELPDHCARRVVEALQRKSSSLTPDSVLLVASDGPFVASPIFGQDVLSRLSSDLPSRLPFRELAVVGTVGSVLLWRSGDSPILHLEDRRASA